MKELHNQILCPTIGWTPNFHAYAIRRRFRDPIANRENAAQKANISVEELDMHLVKIFEEECWVGPQRSTSLDVMFQPLYIGGAMVDDRNIFLGDLVFSKTEKGLDYDLQYVYDFGCWWSHTIRAEPCDAPKDGGVAVLVSGSRHCPPEDTDGITRFCPLIAKLKGLSDGGAHTKLACGPSSPKWWSLVYEELRGRTNTRGIHDPIYFDLSRHRQALRESLRSKQVKPGTEHRSFTSHSRIGMGPSLDGPGAAKPRVKKEVTKATKKCAVCDVTVGLLVCSSCKSIAFCCREHQLEFWPQHKAECKEIRKRMCT